MLELALETTQNADPPAPTGVSPNDRRLHARHTLEELPWLRSVRLNSGPELSVVDFSAGGLKFQVENHLLRPGALVTVRIDARGGRLTVPADVLRCQVLALNASICYCGALAFKGAIDLSPLTGDILNDLASSILARKALDVTLPVDPPLATRVPDADVPPLPVGWNRIVVRYADGRVVKGFCQDFFPPRGHFHLRQTPSAFSREHVTIPIGDLKAVFFVRNFDGNPCHVDDPTRVRLAHGRPIAVTFLDDEEIGGTTMNYQPGASGFFLQPFDPNGNNIRVYVVSRAVRHVRFL